MSNRERKETMLRNGDMNPMMAATQKQMAQAQQTLTALNKRMANPSSDTDTQTHAVIRLNEHRRGLVEFHHPDGDLVTLLISNRVTGEELLKTSYPDGTVLAYIDFSRFALPLDKIRVVYLAEDQKVLGKPALKIEN